jgi:Domain of unknown function (DUF4082)/PEP-CTERM motif
MKLLLSIFTAAALCTAYGQGTFEAIQGYNNPTTAFWDGTVGGTFSVNSYITVTSLGCFDYLFGLNQGTIQVGLWDSTGALIASNTVSASSTPVNQSRYQSIDPVFLDPNQIYHLGAYSTNGTIFLDIAAPGLGGVVTNAPEIALGDSARIEGGFASPVAVPGTPGAFYLGPNFQFQDRVPEPATGLLVGLAGLLLVGFRKWHSRSRK